MLHPKFKEKLGALLLDCKDFVEQHMGDENDQYESAESHLAERLQKMLMYVYKIPKMGEPKEEPFKMDMVPRPSMNESKKKVIRLTESQLLEIIAKKIK